MEWFEDFKEDLAAVFAQAEAVIARFPAPLDRRGLAYIGKFNPLKRDSAKNYICYLLPFWLKDAAPVSTAHCRALSLANVFVMLHFFVQDDVMDTAPEDWKQQLALGSLLQEEYQRQYRMLFPSDSVFWSYARTLLNEWAASVASENADDPFLRAPLRSAKKAAPLQMATVGALLLSGREDRIAPIATLVDHVLVTLQMADDWADWQDDLADGSYNGLLAMIRDERENASPSNAAPAANRPPLYGERNDSLPVVGQSSSHGEPNASHAVGQSPSFGEPGASHTVGQLPSPGETSASHAVGRPPSLGEPGAAAWKLSAAEVRHALYTCGALTRYAEHALANREALQGSEEQAPHLAAFHESLLGRLLYDASHIAEQKRKLAAGGLNYFLSNNAKN